MPHEPRLIVPGHLHEITIRAFQGRFFFVPSKRSNALIVGAMAYAQEKTRLAVCFDTWMSNHAHLLAVPESEEQIAKFFETANQKISLEMGKLCGWRGNMFEGRYKSTVVTPEEDAQIERLAYPMSQGVKEGLVPHPTLWPGVQAATAVLSGTMEQHGTWVRRSDLYEARRREERKRSRSPWRKHLAPSVKVRHFEDRKTLKLSPLPCWRKLGPRELKRRYQSVCQQVLAASQEQRATVARDWRRRITQRTRGARPDHPPARSEKPRVHAASKDSWRIFVDYHDLWLEHYRRASAKLASGKLGALWEFPRNCFLPTGVTPRSKLGVPPPEFRVPAGFLISQAPPSLA